MMDQILETISEPLFHRPPAPRMSEAPATRELAQALGSGRYFTGKPCKRGHASERYTANFWCVECSKINKAKTDATYYLKNEARVNQRRRAYLANNPGYMALWKKRNKDAVNASNRNRRASKVSAEGTHSAEDIVALRSRQRDKCVYCKSKLNGKGHVDHIIALSNGGSDWPNNLQLLCAPCNLAKHNKHPIVFAQQKGMLL